MDAEARQNDVADAKAAVLRADGQLVLKTLAGQRQSFDELIVRYQRQAVAVLPREPKELAGIQARSLGAQKSLKAPAKVRTLPGI